MKKQLTEVQIIGFLGQAEASLPVKQLCLRQGFSEGIVNWLRAARSCPVKSTLPIVLKRRTSPHPIQRTRGCGARGDARLAANCARRGKDSARYREPTRTAGAERPT